MISRPAVGNLVVHGVRMTDWLTKEVFDIFSTLQEHKGKTDELNKFFNNVVPKCDPSSRTVALGK